MSVISSGQVNGGTIAACKLFCDQADFYTVGRRTDDLLLTASPNIRPCYREFFRGLSNDLMDRTCWHVGNGLDCPERSEAYNVVQLLPLLGYFWYLVFASVSAASRSIRYDTYLSIFIIPRTLAGQQFSLQLNYTLCFAQATLIYASPGL
jgi:hypothetical protein